VDRPTVAVVGAGIAGLAAAWELVTGAGDEPPGVVVLEAGPRAGGKLQSRPVAGRDVDVAADAFLARRPEATDLVTELGLDGELVSPGASGAGLWARGRLRAMPDGLNLGVPTRWWPVARSGILGPLESLALLRDRVVPHRGAVGPTGDVAVGPTVARRLGQTVVDRLVDPLVGGIHAGGVADLSAAATLPALLAADRAPGGLMRALARTLPPPPDPDRPPAPVFWSLRGGVAALADALVAALADRGVVVRTSTPVERLTAGPSGRGWVLGLPADGSLHVDGVVLATPGHRTAGLLAPHAPEAAGILGELGTASVTVVTVALPRDAVRTPLEGTGFLVPRSERVAGRVPFVTGCTYLGRKWPHLARPDDELVRLSLGRFGDDRTAGLDDDEVVAVALAELAVVLEVRGRPLDAQVTRWADAFPQYRPGHFTRAERVDELVGALGAVAVAGAASRGVGIPACVGSGRVAARRVRDALVAAGR
jgi:oxygen-dependent protoporphyrinogen oxidase